MDLLSDDPEKLNLFGLNQLSGLGNFEIIFIIELSLLQTIIIFRSQLLQITSRLTGLE